MKLQFKTIFLFCLVLVLFSSCGSGLFTSLFGINKKVEQAIADRIDELTEEIGEKSQEFQEEVMRLDSASAVTFDEFYQEGGRAEKFVGNIADSLEIFIEKLADIDDVVRNIIQEEVLLLEHSAQVLTQEKIIDGLCMVDVVNHTIIAELQRLKDKVLFGTTPFAQPYISVCHTKLVHEQALFYGFNFEHSDYILTMIMNDGFEHDLTNYLKVNSDLSITVSLSEFQHLAPHVRTIELTVLATNKTFHISL